MQVVTYTLTLIILFPPCDKELIHNYRRIKIIKFQVTEEFFGYLAVTYARGRQTVRNIFEHFILHFPSLCIVIAKRFLSRPVPLVGGNKEKEKKKLSKALLLFNLTVEKKKYSPFRR